MMDITPSEPQQWLAETKFSPPLLREDVIRRRRLLENVRNSLDSYPLTLLSAPAGYGKTTLLAALPATYPGLSAAWLSLDEADNDPVRFLTALIGSLQRLDRDCGATAKSLLASHLHQGAGVRRVISVLINDVLETLSDPFALILDDLHCITEPSIFVALDYLLEHRPPQLHLGVATRVDPPLALARLRARGELTELRLAELRFTEKDTSTFLNGRLNLNLSAADLDLLQLRTEGWPVGLRLLATSLDRVESGEGRSRFIQHLARTDRNVFDFLSEEVFNRQDAAIKDFLLETAILPELTVPLCQAVTGRPDAGTLLEQLYRRNLYLVQVSPSDGARSSEPGRWHLDPPALSPRDRQPERRYRYHDLFARFLRHKLARGHPEQVRELHLRAARAEGDLVRAVGHYLAAGEWPEAADLIEQIGAQMFARGYLEMLARWIDRLPAELLQSRPRLLHYLSHCALWKGSFSEAHSLLESALQGFKAADKPPGHGEVLADLASVAAGQGDLERSSELFGQALAYPMAPQARVQSLLGRALATGTTGNWAHAERDFNAAMALVQQSGELDPLHLVTLPFFHPDFAVVPGGLEHLERICEQARAQVGDDVSPSRLMVEELTTILYLFRGQLGEAIRSGERALSLRRRLGGHPFLSLNAALFLLIAHAALGDYGAAEPLFDAAFEGVDQISQPPPDLPLYLYYAGRV
ncbi:MAG: hypothetical protein PVH50_09005, partial [Anaerolineae bacterium]